MDKRPVSNETLLHFLRSHPVAHLATLDQHGRPRISTVYYYVNSMMEIFIVTLEETDKYKNIQQDGNIAFVVTDEKMQQTVQMQGTASLVRDPGVRAAIIEQLAVVQARNKSGWPPPIIKLDKGGLRLVKIKPSWIRFLDFKDPDTIVQYETSE